MTRKRILLGAATVLCVAVGLLVTLRVTGSTADTRADGRVRQVAVEHSVGPGNRDLSGRVQPHGNGRPSPATLWVDGCDHNYADAGGNSNVCVPKVAPGGRTVDCDFLRAAGFGPLKVIGVDSKHLAGPGKTASRGDTVCAS
ncbi:MULTISPECIES: hypothetical protein [unclassified Frankia]|uniref:hypothetical protein n=1 Tax=unclassified Frankia TaxID=2632575 RepID=UPI002AD3F822|nr:MULTISPECIES: hypothetical protein [unclassified Frankia]